MTQAITLSATAAEDLCLRALLASKTSEDTARATARALTRAEADGQKGHGLMRIPSYTAQAQAGKVDGFAKPGVEQVGASVLRIDAAHGFAYPAIDVAIERLTPLASASGIALASVHNSHHIGQAGAHAERLADLGLVALVFGNSPAAMNFWGGRKPMMGTNPIAFAAPRSAASPLVIDLALSRVARGKIVAAKMAGESIPEGWALDAEGQPTTDAGAAVNGSLLPIGGAKGAALALMVEVLAAALTGAHFGYEASSFFDTEGGPPDIGLSILAIDPGIASGGAFTARIEDLVRAIDDTPGARLPGSSRLANRARAAADGIIIAAGLHQRIVDIIEGNPGHG